MKRNILLTFAIIGLLFSTLMGANNISEIQPRSIIIVPDKPSNLEAKIWTDKGEGASYYRGESLQVFFETNKNAYVAIYDILPDGQTNLIFPNKYQKNNYIAANTTTKIPVGYSFKIGPDTGKEYLQIVASTSQFTEYNAWTQDFSTQAFPEITLDAPHFLQNYIKSIIIVPDPEKPEWTSAMTYFYANTSPQMGTVEFNSTPSGAMIWLDGSWIGKTTNYKTTLSSGYHYVKFFMQGYNSYEKEFYLSAGGYVNVSAVLTPLVQQTSKLSVSSSPSGANIYLDGSFKGTTPMTINNVTAGSHNLKLTLQGYQEFQQNIYINAGDTKSISAQLTPVIIPITSKISVYSQPSGANIYLDGVFKGTTPMTISNLKPGTYNVKLTLDGYQDHSENVSVTLAETVNVQLQPKIVVLNGTAKISVKPTTALVSVDGIYYPSINGEVTVSLTAGDHNVKVSNDGYETKEFTLSINSGQYKYVTVQLTEIPKTGKVFIKSNVSTTIFLNGKEKMLLPANTTTSLELLEGNNEIVLMKEGYYVYVTRVNVFAGTTYNVNATMEKIQ